jgi:phospholipid/cholesterol/gamma-HCH transport system substrate-binding protein
MRIRSLPKAVGLTVAAAITLTGCDFSLAALPLPGGADVGDNPVTVKVVFRDVLDLVPLSSVKVNEVTVGRVEDVELDGYNAVVTLTIRKDVELPDNTLAEIRQTSLLGEKFVSLAPPLSGSVGRLETGDVIPLEATGRNPEIEEVLGALSLVLNGGGVAQLKTIASELNKALTGREDSVRSVLSQVTLFMRQVDENKVQVVAALDKLDALAKSLSDQEGSIALALDELPAALDSINRQRADLVKMLVALADLSDIGTHVIKTSKDATIASLRALNPVLNKLAEAGDSFPRSLQVALTYPFVDEVVGQNAQQARDLHMGDYTNLSVQLDIDLSGQTGIDIPGLPGGPNLNQLCKESPLSPLCDAILGTKPAVPLPSLPVPTISLGVPTLPGLPGLPGLSGLLGRAVSGCDYAPCRVAPGAMAKSRVALPVVPVAGTVDSSLAALLMWGMVQR